jgi:hypothetical protein
MAKQTTTVATATPAPTNGAVPKWSVVTLTTRTRTKVPPPEWAFELVRTSYDNKVALGHTFGNDKEARSALHQVRRAADQLGYGLSVQQLGPELRVQAKERKKTATAAS